MNEESVLEYYTKNATPEQTRLVNTVYSCDYIKSLMDLGFNGRKGLTMDEVYLLFLMVNLEKDLDSMQRYLLETSNGDNEETFKEFIDNMEYRYEHIVENNGGNVE